MKSDLKLLVFMKDNLWTKLARKYLEDNFKTISIVLTDGNNIPDDTAYRFRHIHNETQPDWVISFLSSYIIPQDILEWVKIGAINFHPGPPEYPGIGGYNFAIWDEIEAYGITCHFMKEIVDSGAIIQTKTFPISKNITVEGLKNVSMVHLLALFYDIMSTLWKGNSLESNGETWKRKAYTRKDFQEFCKIEVLCTDDNLERKLRASYFPGALDAPNIEVAGKKWRLEPVE